MEIRQLRHFLAIAELGGFGRAAKAQHITQPALSKSIRLLEKELGDLRLFARLPGGTKLTPHGEMLLRHASLIMNDWRRATDDIRSAGSGDHGLVTMGATPSLAIGLLPEVFVRLAAVRPGLRLRLVSSASERLVQLLLRGDLDFFLGPVTDPPPADSIAQSALFRDSVSVVARAGHPVLDVRKPALRDLLAHKWVLYGNEVIARRHFSGIFAAAGLQPPEAAIESDSTEHIKLVVAQSDLLGYLPYCAILAEHKLKTMFPVQVAGSVWKRPVGVSHRSQAPLAPAASAVIAEIRKSARAANLPARP